MFQFPFGTMHQINLDWFLGEWENYKQEWADAQAGIDNALQGEIDRVEDAMTDLYDARDTAVQAKDDAETAAASVVSDAAQCGVDSLKAEGYAVGEQDGIPVGSGSPYYQQNAKYYKVEAGTYRYLSEAYAKGEMGGSPVAPGEAGYQDNAKYYKGLADADAAQTAADRVQTGLDKTATGNDAAATAADRLVVAQDKLDVDTMKDNANQAALRAEGYSVGKQNGTPVGSGSPYYQNNAEYFASLAAAGSGVALSAIPYFDDFSYTDDATVTTAANQQQIDFQKNKITFTRLGSGSTYYMVSLFGSHIKTSGNPPTFDTDSLLPLYVDPADENLDVVIYMKAYNHTSADDAPLSLYAATYNSDTQEWTSTSRNLYAVNQIRRERFISLRKELPAAFTNGNFLLSIRVRKAGNLSFEYSIVYERNIPDIPTP